MLLRKNTAGFFRNGEAHASGPYLWLVVCAKDPGELNVRGFVRNVKLRQSGHGIYGIIHVGTHRHEVFGDLGNYGSPSLVASAVYTSGIQLPARTIREWKETENPYRCAWLDTEPLRIWGLKNINALRRAGVHL